FHVTGVQTCALPISLQVRTGSGGRHIYFAHPGVYIGISAGSIGTGLDIRGDRGLVVAPPSIHPKTKRRYEWINPGTPIAKMPDRSEERRGGNERECG